MECMFCFNKPCICHEEENMKMAMKEINDKGFFYFDGSIHTSGFQAALLKAVQERTLTTLADLGLKFVNESNYYILYGNPRKVKVIYNSDEMQLIMTNKGV